MRKKVKKRKILKEKKDIWVGPKIGTKNHEFETNRELCKKNDNVVAGKRKVKKFQGNWDKRSLGWKGNMLKSSARRW